MINFALAWYCSTSFEHDYEPSFSDVACVISERARCGVSARASDLSSASRWTGALHPERDRDGRHGAGDEYD